MIKLYKVRDGRMMTAKAIADEVGVSLSRVYSRLAAGEDALAVYTQQHTIREPSWNEVLDFVESHPDGASLEEIAEVFKCSRERIRQIEDEALAKLRGDQ